MRPLLWIALVVLVIFHVAVVVMNIAAVFVLPLAAPWYIAVPLVSFIVQLSTSRTAYCPLTALENHLREALGLRVIHGFMGYYFVRPGRRLLGIQRKKRLDSPTG